MTSKKSSDGFGRIFRTAYLPAAAVMTVICVLTALPWLTTGLAETDYYQEIIRYNPFENIIFLFFFAVFTAFAGALCFGFASLKRLSNVYLSIGISRKKQFAARWLGGLTAVLPALVFVAVLILISGMKNHVQDIFRIVLCYTLYIAGSYIFIYSVSCLAFSCGNNLFESTGIALVLLVCACLTDSFYDAAQSLRFGAVIPQSDMFYMSESLMEVPETGLVWQIINPLIGIFDNLSSGLYGEDLALPFSQAASSLGVCLLYSLVLFFLGFYGFGRKTAENCGRFFRSPFLYKITGVVLSLCVFRTVLLSVTLKRLPLCIAAVAAAVAVNILVNAAFVRRFPEKTTPAVALVTIIFCVAFCHADNRLPDMSQVDSVVVYSEYRYTLDPGISDMNYSAIDTGFEVRSDSSAENYFTSNDLSLVSALHNRIGEDGYLTAAYKNAVEAPVEFCYTMKDGSKKYYSYRAVTKEAVEKVVGLEKSEHAQQIYRTLKLGSAVSVQDTGMKVTGTITDTDGLLKALVSDMLTRDETRIYSHSPEDEVAVLSLSVGDVRVRAAAYDMYRDIIENDPGLANELDLFDPEYFYLFFKELTLGVIMEDKDRDGRYETEKTFGNFGTLYSSDEFVIGETNVPEIVKKAAGYYNALREYSDAELEERLADAGELPSATEYNIPVTKDMTETAAFIEKNTEPGISGDYNFESVRVMNPQFIEYGGGYNSIAVTAAEYSDPNYMGFFDNWYYEETVIESISDKDKINSLLDSSVVVHTPADSSYALIFVADNAYFTKFISPEDYEALK